MMQPQTAIKHVPILASYTATVATATAGSADPATNEVQTITLDDGVYATGGTFTITFDGQTTGAIAYNATAATIKTALEALSNIEADDMTVAGTLNTGLTLTFGGTLAATNVAAVTVSLASTTFATIEDVTSQSSHLHAVTLTAGSDAATLTVRAGGINGTTILVLKAAANSTVAAALGRSFCSGGIHATLAGTGPSASFVYE